MEARRIEDAFSMGAFQAFLELNSFQTENPCLTDVDAIGRLTSLRASASGLDFRGGLALHQHLDADRNWKQTENHLRLFVFEWVRIVKPSWLQLVPYGREKVKSALGEDEAQCLREGGLFDDEPDDEAIEWWDRMAAITRGSSAAGRMKRARLTERLSLKHERTRLVRLGIEREPRWVALEDNTLGYDILSYDFDPQGHIVNRLVEVKSRLGGSIILTRNEWDNASGAPQQTIIHVWDLPEERLHEYRAPDLEPNIPQDRGTGAWQDVRIELERSGSRNSC